MEPLSSLSNEDSEYTQNLWDAYGPGIGIAEALLEASRVLDYRLERVQDDDTRGEVRAQMDRIDRISETLYGDRMSEIARAFQQAETDPVAVLAGDRQGLARPLARMEMLGETDGGHGWIDSVEVPGAPIQEVGDAMYALRQQIHLSDPEPGDTYAQSPRGQATRHYWQGAGRALTRRALETLEPGRHVQSERRLQHTAATMDDLGFEEYVTELREDAVERTTEWLSGTSTLSGEEIVETLSAIHRYMVANDIASERSNRAVVHAYAETRARGGDDREAFETFAADAVAATGFSPDEVEEIVEGVVPGDARSALRLRRFRSARQILEQDVGRSRTSEKRDAPAPTKDGDRPRSGGRAL